MMIVPTCQVMSHMCTLVEFVADAIIMQYQNHNIKHSFRVY